MPSTGAKKAEQQRNRRQPTPQKIAAKEKKKAENQERRSEKDRINHFLSYHKKNLGIMKTPARKTSLKTDEAPPLTPSQKALFARADKDDEARKHTELQIAKMGEEWRKERVQERDAILKSLDNLESGRNEAFKRLERATTLAKAHGVARDLVDEYEEEEDHDSEKETEDAEARGSFASGLPGSWKTPAEKVPDIEEESESKPAARAKDGDAGAADELLGRLDISEGAADSNGDADSFASAEEAGDTLHESEGAVDDLDDTFDESEGAVDDLNDEAEEDDSFPWSSMTREQLVDILTEDFVRFTLDDSELGEALLACLDKDLIKFTGMNVRPLQQFCGRFGLRQEGSKHDIARRLRVHAANL